MNAVNGQPQEMIAAATAAALAPVVTLAGAGPSVELGDHRAHIKVSALQHTAGAFALGVTEADPRGGVPPHVHEREDETFYILGGRFTLTVGGRTIEAGPGDTVFAPRDVPHSWYCTGDTPGRFLLLITPGANFEAFATQMAQRGLIPAEAMADPALAAEFMALTARHGIHMLPPGE